MFTFWGEGRSKMRSGHTQGGKGGGGGGGGQRQSLSKFVCLFNFKFSNFIENIFSFYSHDRKVICKVNYNLKVP